LTSLTPSSVDAAPVARITLKATPDDLAGDDEPVVDEKYQLTGEAARQFERGQASWYGPRFHGRLTASSERYDMDALTAANKTLPFGTVVRVRSKVLGREVDVRINDRGPFAPGRVIDVSRAAAEALGLVDAGVADVSLLLLPEFAAPDLDPPPAVQKIRRSTRRAATVKRR
jgi:rare lipoprotein A